MSMLKKLKNIFIVEDETLIQNETNPKATSDTKAPPKSASKSSPKTSTAASSASNKSASTQGGKPATKFVNLLFKAIEENNVEGFDYIEFKNSVRSLTKVEPDEGKRYKSAFAMAGAMGLTKSKLFSSAKHYVSVLDAEEKKFAQAFNGQREKQIVARESKSKQLATSIKEKEAQIKKLQAAIEKDKKSLGTIESDISKAMAKVEATKDGFYGAYHMVLQQIKDDLDKISNYIQ